MTGAGPEGPHTRPKAKPGSEVVRAGCTDLESICEPDGDPDALNLSNCGNVGSILKNFAFNWSRGWPGWVGSFEVFGRKRIETYNSQNSFQDVLGPFCIGGLL